MNTIKNLLLGLSLLIFSQVSIGQNAISDVKLFAERNLQSVLEKIPINDEVSFGFNSREEFKQAELGEALEFIWFSETTDNSNKMWRVPVIVNGVYRALLNVQKKDNEYKIADFGASVLAEDIQNVMNENKDKDVSGILRITAITSDFLIVRSGDKEEYLPLTSAKMFINSREMELQKSYSSSNLIELINKR
jgi:hypothetical protein